MNLIALLLVISSSSFSAKTLVTKLVGSVDKKVVTSKDVQVNYAIDRLFYNDDKGQNLELGTEEFNSAVNRLLVEMIVFKEAVGFEVAAVSSDEIQKDYQRVKGQLAASSKAKQIWQAVGYTDSDLKDMIERKLRANKFIKYKSNSSYVQVSDDEAQEYFNKNRVKFGSVDFESFKPNIKKFLAKKNAEDRLREWFDILRKKYNVKNLVGQNDFRSSLPAEESKN